MPPTLETSGIMLILASQLNLTQQGEVLSVLDRYTATSIIPLFLVECFLMGTLVPLSQRDLSECGLPGLLGAWIPVGSYMLWWRYLHGHLLLLIAHN